MSKRSRRATVVFRQIDPAVWRVASSERVPAGERDSAATVFAVYERIAEWPGG